MGYLYLTLALFAGVAKGFCGKKISSDMETFRDCVYINVMRMLFCAAIGFIFVVAQGEISAFYLNAKNIGVYLLSAVSMTAFCVCWMYAYKQDAYVFLNVFTMLGAILTCFYSLLVYGEPIEWNEWVGILLVLCAVVIMSKYNKEVKGKLPVIGAVILVVGCIGSSVADFSQKIYVKNTLGGVAAFNFYTYAFGFVLLSLLYGALLLKKEKEAFSSALSDKKHTLSYFLMSLFLFLNTSLKTLAATFLTSAQIYPVLQGANLVLSGLMAHVLFKERSSVKSITGMSCAFVGLLIMNML